MVGLRLNEAKSELEPVQDNQFLGLRLHLDQGRASLPVSKAREIMAHACRTSSQKTLSYTEVSQFMGSLNRASGLIPLGRLHLRPLQRHFHSLGLTNRFSPLQRSDPLVLATLLKQWQDLSFLTLGIPIQPFQVEFTIFTNASTQGWGTHYEDGEEAFTCVNVERPISSGNSKKSSLNGIASNDEAIYNAACRAQSNDVQIYIGVDTLNGRPVKVLRDTGCTCTGIEH